MSPEPVEGNSPREETSVETRILEAAAKMLRHSSPSSLSYRAVARQTDLPHSTVQYHFPTREELLTESMKYNVEVWVDRARKVRDEVLALSPEERKRQLPRFLVRAILPNKQDIRSYLIQGLTMAEYDKIAEKNREGRVYFDKYVREILDSADFHCPTDVVIALVDGLAYETVSEGLDFPENVIEKVSRFLTHVLSIACRPSVEAQS